MWNHIKTLQKMKSLLPLNLKIRIIRFLVYFQQVYYSLNLKKPVNFSNSKKLFIYF